MALKPSKSSSVNIPKALQSRGNPNSFQRVSLYWTRSAWYALSHMLHAWKDWQNALKIVSFTFLPIALIYALEQYLSLKVKKNCTSKTIRRGLWPMGPMGWWWWWKKHIPNLNFEKKNSRIIYVRFNENVGMMGLKNMIEISDVFFYQPVCAL